MANLLVSEMDFNDILSIPMANAENLTLEIEALSKAVEKEAECEVHCKALADREMGWLHQETVGLEKDLLLLMEKKAKLEVDLNPLLYPFYRAIFHTEYCHRYVRIIEGMEKEESVMSRLDWDQETLDAWLDKSAEEDEDTMLLLKYCGQDEARIQDLTLGIDRATLEINQKNKALDAEWTKKTTAQVELDRVKENFHRAHIERQDLIHQWENTIEQMRKRDRDLEQCLTGNQEVRERQEAIAEKRRQLESQQRSNQECGGRAEEAKQQASKLRDTFQENEHQCAQLKSEFESLKASVEQVATKVEVMRSQLTGLQHDNEEKSSRLRDIRLNNAALEQKLKGLTELTVGVEGTASKVEKMLEEEELASGDLESVIHHHRRLLSQKTQELQVLKSRQDNSTAMISSTRDILRSMHNNFDKVEEEFIKGNELIHIKDHQLKIVKEKLTILTAEPTPEEELAHKRSLAELSTTLEERKRTSLMLSQQLRTSKVEGHRVRKDMEKAEMQMKSLSSKLVEMELSNEMSEKELKKLIFKNQEMVVEDSLLRLDTKGVRDRLQCEVAVVLSLEKEEVHLTAERKAKELKIDYSREVLQTQVRMGNHENQSLRMEMNENLSRIDKMKTRYETKVVPTLAPDGKESGPWSRPGEGGLKRKGNALDKKVRRKETEIEALENTLHTVSRTTEHRKLSGQLSHSTEDYQLQLELEEQQRAMNERYSFRLRQITALQQDIDGMNNTLEDLHQEEATAKVQKDENRTQTMTLNKKLDAQKERLERVTKQCSKLSGDIRLSKKVKGMTEEEHDIDLSEMKAFDKTVDKLLLEAMEGNPHLRSVLFAYFQEKSLLLPEAVLPAVSFSLGPRSARSARSVRSFHGSSIRADSPPPQVYKLSSGAGSSTNRSAQSFGSNQLRPESATSRVFKPTSCMSSARSSSPVRSARSGSDGLRPLFAVTGPFKSASHHSSSRSSVASFSGSSRSAGRRSPRMMVDLGLQFTVTSALLVPTPPRGSRQGASDTGRSTSSRKSQQKTP
ncbi:hypothetical protein AAFF_G00087160 [Aldrovandia affinis]|uniref:Coiled-coil domain-containing protein 39 n=1 Tax=Aldrovandia affinis TaxID=143900 RepID=A0AAD7WCJ7_9TELE|nr:hypothetical protein AAFF_G00087160 [Aldrovandia affinis]